MIGHTPVATHEMHNDEPVARGASIDWRGVDPCPARIDGRHENRRTGGSEARSRDSPCFQVRAGKLRPNCRPSCQHHAKPSDQGVGGETRERPTAMHNCAETRRIAARRRFSPPGGLLSWRCRGSSRRAEGRMAGSSAKALVRASTTASRPSSLQTACGASEPSSSLVGLQSRLHSAFGYRTPAGDESGCIERQFAKTVSGAGLRLSISPWSLRTTRVRDGSLERQKKRTNPVFADPRSIQRGVEALVRADWEIHEAGDSSIKASRLLAARCQRRSILSFRGGFVSGCDPLVSALPTLLAPAPSGDVSIRGCEPRVMVVALSRGVCGSGDLRGVGVARGSGGRGRLRTDHAGQPAPRDRSRSATAGGGRLGPVRRCRDPLRRRV